MDEQSCSAALGGAAGATAAAPGRFAVLDGWRGISILVVLAAHLLPLGPKDYLLNVAAGSLGMSLFFAMSGFLITTTLIRPGGVGPFFIRRLFRIVPLAWFYLVIVLIALGASARQWLTHMFFLVNYDTDAFEPLTLHFWSLCVEVHFYLAIGLLFALFGRRSLVVLPIAMLCLTLGKIVFRPDVQMSSHLRWDEIMAGVMLALIYHGDLPGADWFKRALPAIPIAVSGLVLVLTCPPQFQVIQWLRPYAAMMLVGATLFSQRTGGVKQLLRTKTLAWVAGISYALYVIHPATTVGWLGEGGSAVDRYLLKRPISLALAFGLAWLSTRHYESHFISLGKRIIRRDEARRERVTPLREAGRHRSRTAPGEA